jgi:hypothetical protein
MTRKADERWERLAALGVQREIATPEGETSMSAVVLQLAEPLLKQHGKTPQRSEAIIMLTIAAWNKSMFPVRQAAAHRERSGDSRPPRSMRCFVGKRKIRWTIPSSCRWLKRP